MAARPKPRVFVNSDVLFAAAAGPTRFGASLVVLRMAEITLVEAVASRQVMAEVERNLKAKAPRALPAFNLLVDRCLDIVEDPKRADLQNYAGLADEKDLPILVAALRQDCSWLVTHNARHFQPGHPEVTALEPWAFVRRVRQQLAILRPSNGE